MLRKLLSKLINADKLRERNRVLESAVANMRQGLSMFDANGRLVLWNTRYLDTYGPNTRHVYEGMTLRELMTKRAASGAYDLDVDDYIRNLTNAVREDRPLEMEFDLPDGRSIYIKSQPLPDGGWLTTHEDITERVQGRRELDRTRTFLDMIIENVPSPILVKEFPGGRYVLINRAAADCFGMPREQILGQRAEDIFPPQSAAFINARDAEMLETGKSMHFDEHIFTTPQNKKRIVTSSRLPVSGPDGELQYIIGVIHDQTDRKRDQALLKHMALHDPLTDLPNRTVFNQCLAKTIESAAAANESFALLCLDMDRFKEVNDLFGQTVGDALLCEIALRLQSACPGALIARLGGDEFAVITGVGPQPATADEVAIKLSDAISGEIEVEGHRLRTSVTMGVGIFPADGVDATTLLANADAALYRAKEEARGSVRYFEPVMDKSLREKRVLQHDFRSAIERDELELHYQPQALIDGTITGFEALVRWRHPERGLISPATFIPLAEESGLIHPLGEWIMRAACREAASWPKPLRIAINMSPVQFRQGDLAALVHSVLLESGLSPSRLELEITEGVLIGDFSRAVAILRRIKNLGVRIAMDDFGTGYSSLSYLHSFPFDKIKIDRAFIANVNQNPQSVAIIRAVIGLGRGLSLPVLAEGVETKEQLAFLAAESCDEVQGYLIGHPKPIDFYAELVGRAAQAPRVALAG